jgi:hypothetical protein
MQLPAAFGHAQFPLTGMCIPVFSTEIAQFVAVELTRNPQNAAQFRIFPFGTHLALTITGRLFRGRRFPRTSNDQRAKLARNSG